MTISSKAINGQVKSRRGEDRIDQNPAIMGNWKKKKKNKIGNLCLKLVSHDPARLAHKLIKRIYANIFRYFDDFYFHDRVLIIFTEKL